MNWARACDAPAQAAIAASSAVARQAAIRARDEIIMLVPTPSSNLATGKWRTKNEDRRHFQPQAATASKRLTFARHGDTQSMQSMALEDAGCARDRAALRPPIFMGCGRCPASQPAHAFREDAGRLVGSRAVARIPQPGASFGFPWE